jgi:hypothetical protein
MRKISVDFGNLGVDRAEEKRIPLDLKCKWHQDIIWGTAIVSPLVEFRREWHRALRVQIAESWLPSGIVTRPYA